MNASTTLTNVNESATSLYLRKEHDDIDIILTLQNLIASVGIVCNCTMVVVFLQIIEN